MMVMTVVEAHVAPENWSALENAYSKALESLPAQIVQTFLAHSTTDATVWQVISVWRSYEALIEFRRSVETPGGVLIFRSAGAEPSFLSILDVVTHGAGTVSRA